MVVSIVPYPVVVTNNPGPVCAPQTINLTNASITNGSTTGLVFTYFTDAAASNAYNNPINAISGVYFVKGTDVNGCFAVKPVTVTYYPVPIVYAGADTVICFKDSAILHATVTNITAPVTYQWDPVVAGGVTQPTAAITLVKPSASQQYILTVKDTYGCNFSVNDTVLVTMQPQLIPFAGNDTIASAGVPHQLLASGGSNYLWSPTGPLNNAGIANPLATLRNDTRFIVQVKNIAGCTGYDTVFIKVYNGITYYVPNAFSPNLDGVNDYFKPISVGIIATDYFRIFNRYGEMVYESKNWDKGWDGFYKGKQQAVGNYVWVIKGKGSNGKIIEMRGNVLLVR